MMWDLPLTVEIHGKTFFIRNKCDYRVILDCIYALKDEALPQQERLRCALFIFYENSEEIKDIQEATRQMMLIINNGKEEKSQQEQKPVLMDWQHDFPVIAPPISRVLGYSVRDPNQYTHWYDFTGAYMEIGGDCCFANITAIRSKIRKGIKLEKHEEEFYRENKEIVDLSQTLTEEEKEWLFSD